MSNDSSTNLGAGVLCILLCIYGASMFAAAARIAESGSEELISERVIKGSLLLDLIICSMISFVRLFRLSSGRPFGLPICPFTKDVLLRAIQYPIVYWV